ncbi:hypothetical protein H4R20_000455 [Coemansia guatemalensis]|uniref:Uncharacterized protein n=1 Tax=Coemansia guatemalensis TaxID=2761395 RepID=A0A9W8HYX0_9FUNG|nr:hypothetical protein H4R20_000455 [Coemansia guatemalensis]
MAQQDGDVSEGHAAGSNDRHDVSHSYSGISHGKLEHIFRYIEDQQNSNKQRLTMTAAGSRETLSEKCCSRSRQTDERDAGTVVTAEASRQPAHKGRRALHKRLHIPTRTASQPSPSGPVAPGTPLREGEVPFLGTIQALPTGSKGQKPRHLGIFNKGKAVVSTNSGSAFSEREFLHKANICRIQLDSSHRSGAQQCSRAKCMDGVQEGAWGRQEIETNHPRSRDEPSHCRSTSEHADRVGSRRSSHGSPCSDGAVADSIRSGRPCYSGGSFVPETSPKRIRGMLPDSIPSIHSDTHMSEEQAATTPDLPTGGDPAPDTLALGHASLHGSGMLLNSINECLGDDFQQVSPPSCASRRSCSTDDLNISMLFEEPNTGYTSAFNIRDCSLGALSAFDSSFFASQEMPPPPRCIGDVTVSDFGNSRYGPGMHGSGFPSWTARSSESMQSVDTLPEYVPQPDLPPPYQLRTLSPQEFANDSLRDMRLLNRSRANINVSTTYARRQRSRSISARAEPAIVVRRSNTSSRAPAYTDSLDLVELRPFPRRMC